MAFRIPALWHRISLTSVLCAFACASILPQARSARELNKPDGPPYRLTVHVIDDEGRPALGAYVRVIECCHTEAGPCGRVPVDEKGQARLNVCPTSDGIVRVTLTPDPKSYRVPPINEFEILSDATVTVTVSRHQKVLQHLKKD